MSLPLRVRRRAELDMNEAYAWYEVRLAGLGDAFLNAVEACFDRIEQHPEGAPQVEGRVRRARLRRFPFCVHYVVREDCVDVLAIYHSRRRPRSFEPTG